MKRLLPVLLLAVAAACADRPGPPAAPAPEPAPPAVSPVAPMSSARAAASPHEREQLALLESLDWSDVTTETRATVARLFDLERGEGTGTLEQVLAARGAYREQSGVRAVVAANGPAGLVWVLEKFETTRPEVKGRLLDSLMGVPHREAWRFLETRLEDASPAPSWRGSKEAPPGSSDLRSCDVAARTLGARLLNAGIELPPELGRAQVSAQMSPEQRDARIQALRSWLASNEQYRSFVAKQPSALPGLRASQQKPAADLLGRLGVSSE